MIEENESVAGEQEAQPATTDHPTSGADALRGALCIMGGQMTQRGIVCDGVFRAGDTCERGTVKYPTPTDAAEQKGQ